jgi:hypothetical protein
MTVPYYVNEHQSDIRAIKSGWSNGKLSSGPYPTRGNASPESFAHRPGCGGPLSVPNVEASTSGRALA